MDVHLTDHRRLAEMPLQVTAGVTFVNLDEGRRGYLNFLGTDLGVKGALRKDENDTVYDLDEYLQLQWDPDARWLEAGVRNSVVDVSDDDHLAEEAGRPAMSGVRYDTGQSGRRPDL